MAIEEHPASQVSPVPWASRAPLERRVTQESRWKDLQGKTGDPGWTASKDRRESGVTLETEDPRASPDAVFRSKDLLESRDHQDFQDLRVSQVFPVFQGGTVPRVSEEKTVEFVLQATPV